MLRIGTSTYSLSKAIQAGTFDVLGAFAWIAENGGEHVEIVPREPLSPDAADAMAVKAKETGIAISCYTFGASFIDRTPEEFRAELRRVQQMVEMAARLGTQHIRHDVAFRPVGQNDDAQFERDLPFLVEACGEIADAAARHGITSMIENHGMHVQGADRVLRVFHAVGRANFRLLVDTGNFFAVEFEQTQDAIRRCAPFAAMVHVKDHFIRATPPDEPEGWRDRGRGIFTRVAIAGEGDIGIAEALASLRAAGYDGDLSLEYEGPEDALCANKRGMENLRRFLGQA